MASHKTRRRLEHSMMTSLAVAILALICNSRDVESLAFLDSRSSSSFTNTCTNYDYHVSSTIQSRRTASSSSSSSSSLLTMKVSGQSKRNRSSKSSHLIEMNNQRLQTAGRPGTKKFMDPNKVFIGNLPYDATEEDVYNLFGKHWNVPTEAVGDRIESIKIIRDWKTNQSKGYGFIQFYEPMVATSAMESINKGTGKGWRIKGRKIRLDQGKRKESEEDPRDEKKKKQQQKKLVEDLDEEGMVIHSVLEDVEGTTGSVGSPSVAPAVNGEVNEEDDDGLGMSEDDMITFMEKGGLRGVMPLTEETAGFLGIEGLYDDDDEGYDDPSDYFEEYYNENGYSDEDFEGDDNSEEEDDDDGEEIVYDGVFEEMYNPNEYEGLSDEEEEEMKKMNREQRRAAEKRRKKRKLPFKGFGAQP